MEQLKSCPRMNRRDILRSSALFAGGLLAGHCGDSVPGDPEGVIDTHIHLWAANRKKFPFHPNAPYIPEEISTIEQWEDDRQNTPVTRGVFVQGSPYLSDHRYLLHCLETAPHSLLGIARFDPLEEGNPERLEELARGRSIVGARIHSTGEHVPYWGTSNIAALWEKVGELDLALQIHMHPRWSYELEKMIRQYPGVRVVIDHLGRPTSGDAVDYETILGLSVFPNVFIKVSALNEHSKIEPPYLDLQPLLERIADCFSPQRMVWGSNVYRGGMGSAAYAECLAVADTLLSFLSAEDRRTIFCDSPRRLFRV